MHRLRKNGITEGLSKYDVWSPLRDLCRFYLSYASLSKWLLHWLLYFVSKIVDAITVAAVLSERVFKAIAVIQFSLFLCRQFLTLQMGIVATDRGVHTAPHCRSRTVRVLSHQAKAKAKVNSKNRQKDQRINRQRSEKIFAFSFAFVRSELTLRLQGSFTLRRQRKLNIFFLLLLLSQLGPEPIH